MKKDPRTGILVCSLGIITAIVLHATWNLYSMLDTSNPTAHVVAAIVGAILSFASLINKQSIDEIVYMLLQMYIIGVTFGSAIICLIIGSPDWSFSYGILGYCIGGIVSIACNPQLRRRSKSIKPTRHRGISDIG